MFVKNHLPSRIDHNPPGCTPLRNEDRIPIIKVVSGDTWHLSAELTAADGGPASPENSYVEFVLSENQFSPPLWTGEWVNGVLPDKNRPGLVHIHIPQEFTKTLRRGSYMFSLRVADRTKFSFDTQLVGNFLVEYMPTSDQHSIPYRDGTSEIFGGGSSSGGSSGGGSSMDDKTTNKIFELLNKAFVKIDENSRRINSQDAEIDEITNEVEGILGQLGEKVDEEEFEAFDDLTLHDTATQHEIKTMLQSVLAKLKAIKGDENNG